MEAHPRLAAAIIVVPGEDERLREGCDGHFQHVQFILPTVETLRHDRIGPAFADFHEFRRIIASHDRDFTCGVTKALLEYALGRPCGFADEPLAAELVDRAASHDFGLRTLIHQLVASDAFRQK